VRPPIASFRSSLAASGLPLANRAAARRSSPWSVAR
jgi:hypothetical protein